MDGGAWWAAVRGVAKSWTRLSDFTFTSHFHSLEKEMQPTPGTGEPGGLPSVESQSQIRLKWLSSNSQEIVKGREAWYAEVHGVAKSGTQLSDWTTPPIIPWIFLEHFCLNWNVHQHAFLTWIGYPLSVLLLQYLLQLSPQVLLSSMQPSWP